MNSVWVGAVVTALLFTLVNMVYNKSHIRNMTLMGGYGHVMPGIAAFFVLPEPVERARVRLVQKEQSLRQYGLAGEPRQGLSG